MHRIKVFLTKTLYETESEIWDVLGQLGSLEFMNFLYFHKYFEEHLGYVDKKGKNDVVKVYFCFKIFLFFEIKTLSLPKCALY